MKIEVGKTYVDRSGDKVKITGHNNDSHFSFIGVKQDAIGRVYNKKGEWWVLESVYDLVSEVTDEDADTTITLKIGGVYMTRCGKEVTVVDIEDDEIPVVALTKKHKTRRYQLDGVYDYYAETKFDIVAIISEPLSELESKNVKLNQIQDAIDGRSPNGAHQQCKEALFIRNLKCKYDQAMAKLQQAKSEDI